MKDNIFLLQSCYVDLYQCTYRISSRLLIRNTEAKNMHVFTCTSRVRYSTSDLASMISSLLNMEKILQGICFIHILVHVLNIFMKFMISLHFDGMNWDVYRPKIALKLHESIFFIMCPACVNCQQNTLCALFFLL